MDMASIVDMFSVVAVVSGLVFAGLELRQLRRSRTRESALELLNTIQTPGFLRGLQTLTQLPDDVSREQAEEILGDKMEHLFSIAASLEGLGALVYRREFDLDMVEDFFSGIIVVAWSKMRKLIEDQREEVKRETWGEWMQWLAERVIEREASKRVIPAHIAYQDWQLT